MLLTLIKKEIISHILSLRFAVTFGLIVLFIFSGFYVSVIEYRQNVEEFHILARHADENLNEIVEQEDRQNRFYRLYYGEGVVGAVPVPPLSAIAQGLSGVWPAAFRVNAEDAINISKSKMRNPLTKLFRTPDFIYIINVILSLLAMLFIFDGICGEKEAGTLRLMLSYSVPRYQVLLAKWLGGYLVLFVPFVIAILAGLTYARFQGVLAINGESVKLLGFLMFIASVYISIFFTLGLFISTVAKRAFTSLLICLFVWVVLILIIPNLAPIMGNIISPIPSYRKIEAEKEAVEKEIQLRMNRIWMEEGQSSRDQMDVEREKLREEGIHRKNRWDRFYKQARLRQIKVSEGIGRISASASWVYSAFSLLKAGPVAYQNMLDSRNRMKRDMEKSRDVALDKRRTIWQWPDIRKDNMPKLNLQFYDTNRAIANALNDILLLIILNVFFFMCAFLFFLRYDVR